MKESNLVGSENISITDESFEDIYSSFSNKIFNFAFKMVGNKTIAEDLTQETFIQVYKSYKNFKGKSSLLTWIYGIAKNVCFSHFKKNSFSTFEEIIEKESTIIENNQYDEIEKKFYIYQIKEGCLLGLLRCLSFFQRISFILNILFEIPIKEVSDIIGRNSSF